MTDTPRLVLLHGWSIDSRVWGGVRASLRGSVDTLAPDLPGHGDQPLDLRGCQVADYHDAAVKAFARWCDEHEACELPMMAWAWGSQVLVDAIATGSVQPRSVALVSFAAPFQTPATFAAVTRDWPHYARTLVRMMTVTAMSRETEEWLASVMSGSSITAVAGVQASAWVPPDGDFVLPTGSLGILGAGDRLNPPGDAMALLERWGAATTVLDDVGHIPFTEDPAGFEQVLLSWLKGTAAC